MYYLRIILLLLITLGSCKEDKSIVVISKIKKASKLVTTEFTIDKAVFANKYSKIVGIKLGEANFLAYTKAFIKAGVDLNKLDPEKIHIKEKSIRITFPPVEIINFSYPIEKFTIDKNVFGKTGLAHFTLQDYDSFYQQAESNIRANLKYLGIKETTEEKTRKMMVSLLKNLGYENIYISFEEGKLIDLVKKETTKK